MARVRLSAWTRATPDELVAHLRAADPAALVHAIREASDESLVTLVHDVGRGRAVVEVVTSRIGDLAVPAQRDGVRGVVRWESGDPALAVTVRFADGVVEPVTDAGERPDLVVRGSLVQLLRLVAGQLEIAVAYLGRSLEIEGDSALALALAGLFAADGTAPLTGVPVDPRDIDPLDVSRALHGVDIDHLRSVLASGFRPVVLDEIFSRMPAHVNGRKAAGARITVGFRLTGRPDGEVDRYVLRLSDGQATVLAGEAADAVGPDDRDATVTCEAHDFLRLVTGHLSAITGVLRGQLRVRGDKAAALRLATAFDIPKAAA